MTIKTDQVLVTGASGFIGMHCVIKLLERGFAVRGTLRSLGRAEALRKTFEKYRSDRLEFVEADLGSDAGWAEAVRGCRFVLHVASPVPSAAPKHADDVILPARDGTLRVLRAAAAAGVERVVMTSSTAAVFFGHARDGSKIYDERDWSIADDLGAYEKSKTLAERAAWDFVAGERLQLCTLQPGAVLGPILDQDFSVSGEIVRKLLTREFPGCPDLGWSLVDVRDVAEAHVLAMTHPRAAGERFIVGSRHVPMAEIAQILSRHGYQVPTRRLPSWLLKLVALWDQTAALTVRELGKRQDVTSQKAQTVLGWKPREVEQMILDMAESMVRLGAVKLKATPISLGA